MSGLQSSLSILAGRSQLRLVQKCLFGDIEPSRSQPSPVHIQSFFAKRFFGNQSITLGVKTICSVARNKTLIARNCRVFRRVGIKGVELVVAGLIHVIFLPGKELVGINALFVVIGSFIAVECEALVSFKKASSLLTH